MINKRFHILIESRSTDVQDNCLQLGESLQRKAPADPTDPALRTGPSTNTSETTTGRLIMQYASENIIPVTLELGGKSPNIFFADTFAKDDDFLQKTLEGFTMFALNQGEVCTCPLRALVEQSFYADFMERAVARTQAIKQGNPLDTDTMIGAQASNDQLEKNYVLLRNWSPGEGQGADWWRAVRRLLCAADDL